jgi:hypothetical protein
LRVPFELKNFEPMRFVVDGVNYTYSHVKHLAVKRNMTANIYENVVETPDGKKVWLTVVGDTDEIPLHGIERGWYVAQKLSEEDATVLVAAFSEFTKMYTP